MDNITGYLSQQLSREGILEIKCPVLDDLRKTGFGFITFLLKRGKQQMISIMLELVRHQ